MYLTPSAYVIETFGGVRATARALSLDPSTVSRWHKPRIKGDGGVPRCHHKEILRIAKSKNLDITMKDLIYGRRVRKKGR